MMLRTLQRRVETWRRMDLRYDYLSNGFLQRQCELSNGFLRLKCELRKDDRKIIGDVRGSFLRHQHD